MLGKRSWAAPGKLAGPLRSGLVDSSTSPRSPLECKMGSPRAQKNYDHGGVGLGIVVALDKSSAILGGACGGGGEILAKYTVRGQSPACSSPIPFTPSSKVREMDLSLDEEFTYVTCHGPNNSVTTKVYYDGGVRACNKINLHGGNIGVFKISPMVLYDENMCHSTHDSDFLSSCHMCRKALHGKDIYMYRGEKAFCSTECRQRQIGIDERKEQCRSELSRSNDVVSSSPCSGGQIFSNGIIAV